MQSIKSIQKIIEKELQQFFNNGYNQPANLYEPIRYILSIGGKRLRPTMVLLACNLYNENIISAIPAALAIETFHNFTLLHDDIMDNSPMRRSQPTVHNKWNNNVAILSGDAMSILAYELIAKVDIKYLKSVLEIFNKTALQICEGQQYDMDFETTADITVENYLEMIQLKTSVLLGASFEIGAIIGGADKTEATKFYELGLNLGLAFQLQDDYLDTYGDAQTFGKRIGGDIVSNKKTFMLLTALQKANEKQLRELQFHLNKTMIPDEEKIIAVTNIYNTLDIPNIALQKIDAYFDKSAQIVESLNLTQEKKQFLAEFIQTLNGRKK